MEQLAKAVVEKSEAICKAITDIIRCDINYTLLPDRETILFTVRVTNLHIYISEEIIFTEYLAMPNHIITEKIQRSTHRAVRELYMK